MVLGLTIAPILYNAPGNTSGVGFQRLPVDMVSSCDTAKGIVVNELWLLICVPVYICAYNVYLKVLYSSFIWWCLGLLTKFYVDPMAAVACYDYYRKSWLCSRFRFKTQYNSRVYPSTISE